MEFGTNPSECGSRQFQQEGYVFVYSQLLFYANNGHYFEYMHRLKL